MPGRGTIVSAGEDPAYKCAYKFDFISQYGCGFATMQEALDYIGIPEEEAGSSGVDVGWIIIFMYFFPIFFFFFSIFIYLFFAIVQPYYSSFTL